MSDQINAPVVTETAAQPTAPATGEPAWLPDRLERAKLTAQKDLLTQLGVSDVSEVRTALAALKTLREAEQNDMQKLQERVKALEPLEQKLQAYSATMSAMAQSAIAGLSEPQRAAVNALAGDDPSAQLRAIDALRPTWSASVPVATAPVIPANTAVSAQPPPPATVTSPNHLQTWNDLKTKNPIIAAHYRLQHAAEISKQLATQTT